VGKPVAGEVVVIAFPHTDLSVGKRRPALVVADLPGADLILCQITSQQRYDGLSISLAAADFERGQLHRDSFVRPQRLFTVDASIILYSVGNIRPVKLAEILATIRRLFS
jgi:mRNA interferase MazF